MGERSAGRFQWKSTDQRQLKKNLTEKLGLRGRQEHYDAYVEDLVIRQQEDGSEVVEFREGPNQNTKRRSVDQAKNYTARYALHRRRKKRSSTALQALVV